MRIFYIPKKNLRIIFIFIVLLIITLPITYNKLKSTFDSPVFMYSNNYFVDRVIVVDAGHGGIDSGVVHSSGLMEKDINLDIARHLMSLLEDSGAKCVMTREEDIELSQLSTIGGTRHRRDLNARVNIIDSNNADLFVSIHVNSFPSDKNVNGPIVFYYHSSSYSKEIAEVLQNRLNIEYNKKYRNNHEILNKPRGESYYILKNSKSPGVIIETGFMSNPDDYKLLSDPKFREFVAYQIYIGIGEFLED